MGKKNPFSMGVNAMPSKQISRLNKEYGEGNWSLQGGKGYAASGTTSLYKKGWGGYRDVPVYSKLPEPPKPAAPAAAPAPAAAAPAPQSAAPGTLAVGDFQDPQGPDTSAQEALAATIAQMQQGFMQSIQQQQQMFQQMQDSQTKRMEALQNQMMQAQIEQQQRPEVAGVKMASGQAGTPMQIAKRGVSGAFGRKGMRIQSLNV